MGAFGAPLPIRWAERRHLWHVRVLAAIAGTAAGAAGAAAAAANVGDGHAAANGQSLECLG